MKMAHKALALFVALVMVFSCVQVSALAAGGESTPVESNVVTSSEPIESAFTDSAFLAAVRELIGKTHGEHIYQSDVESITELNIFSLDIESLDGIEYFEALTDLICYDNAFVTLDLSNNPNLEVLDCSYCPDLIAIDVSNCPELRDLDCNNTEIERLDLRQNPKLTTLYAYETQLRTLNTSNNVLLETMEVWGGHLVNLDVSNNTALEFLDCSYNNMASSESITGLANCTALEDDAFFFSPQDTRPVTDRFTDEDFLSAVREAIEKPNGDIYAEDLVEITNLAVNNSGLTSLDGIEFMSSLQTLDCTSNHLDELDLYSNKELTSVQCADNDITELDLSGNAELLTLNAAHNLMTDLNVSNSLELKDVDVTDNLLKNIDLTNNVALESLYCAENELASFSAVKLPESTIYPTGAAQLFGPVATLDGFTMEFFPQVSGLFTVRANTTPDQTLKVTVGGAKNSSVKIYDITDCDLTGLPPTLLENGNVALDIKNEDQLNMIEQLSTENNFLGDFDAANQSSSGEMSLKKTRQEYKILAVHFNRQKAMDAAQILTVPYVAAYVTNITAYNSRAIIDLYNPDNPLLTTYGAVTFTVFLANDANVDQVSLNLTRNYGNKGYTCILTKVSPGQYQGVINNLKGGETYSSIGALRAAATLNVQCTYNLNESAEKRYDLLTKPFRFVIDPSGYIYEGVPSNRLSNVKATLYYMDRDGIEVEWDATEYEQNNPLFTDNMGHFEWFVPDGLWRVKAERESYETLYTNWVRVPPAQMDMNFGMVSYEQPAIDLLCAYRDVVEINFNKYVYADDVTQSNITVYANDQQIAGTLELVNAEVDHWEGEYDLNKSGGTGTEYVSKIKFFPSSPLTLGSTIKVHLNDIRSYANVTVAANYSKESVVAVKPEYMIIHQDSAILSGLEAEVNYGETKTIQYSISPISSARGKKLFLTNSNPFAVSVPTEVIVNENGIASIPITGLNLGDTNITLALEGSNLTGEVFVDVQMHHTSGGGGPSDEVPEIPPDL